MFKVLARYQKTLRILLPKSTDIEPLQTKIKINQQAKENAHTFDYLHRDVSYRKHKYVEAKSRYTYIYTEPYTEPLFLASVLNYGLTHFTAMFLSECYNVSSIIF
jgi:hypothetical protein